MADRILLTKTDLAAPEVVAALEARLVFITRGITRAEIERSFTAFQAAFAEAPRALPSAATALP